MTLPPTDLGPTLLAIARHALAQAFDRPGPAWSDADPRLHEPGASFVTLTQEGELRGCIGSLAAHRALRIDVADNARSAAFRDPRFPALAAAELESTEIEVSLLSVARSLPVETEEDACRRLRPGVDGVILTAGARRSTFLPQVWEDLPEPAEFLAHLKRKAGLPARGWPAGTRLETYEVVKFRERDAAGDTAREVSP